MGQRKWPQQSRNRDEPRTTVTLKVPQEYAKALKMYAREQTKLAGYKVSQSAVILTLTQSCEPRLRQLQRELRTETSSKKSIPTPETNKG